MKQNNIAGYFYPTTTILVDDSPSFLKTLDFALGHQFKCGAFADPEQALDYITENIQEAGVPTNKYLESEEAADSEKRVIVNLADIHKEIYNKNRFKEIAVAVIDYAMPAMNGMELCRKIRELDKSPIKLIMLTGEADYPLAVQAFNEGLIDRFVLKSKGNYIQEVAEAIAILQEKYFYDLSGPIRGSLQPEAQALLSEKSFIEIFNQIIKENNYKEFYLLDDSMSCLFLDEAGENLTGLVVKTESDMETACDLAKYERGISPDIIHALEKRTQLPFFPDKKSKTQSAKSWSLHDAKRLGKNCYYAIIENAHLSERKAICSYQKYLGD